MRQIGVPTTEFVKKVLHKVRAAYLQNFNVYAAENIEKVI